MKAGEHNLRASFPELADLPTRGRTSIPTSAAPCSSIISISWGRINPSKEPPDSYRKVFVCDHAPGKHTAECARKAVESVMRRAYRRPVTPAEVDAKYKLVAVARKEGDSLDEGVRLALQAILVSPDFLFHLERDPKAAAGAHPVSNYEFASRLSYFLWASMPDEELLRPRRSGTTAQAGRAGGAGAPHDGRSESLTTWSTTSPRSGCNFAISAAPNPIRRASPRSTMNCSTTCATRPACLSKR